MAVVLADSPPDVIAFALATFIDSTVVGILLEHARAAASGGRAFAVFLPETAGEYVRGLIETTRLDSILPLHKDWHEMLASVEQPRPISATPQQSVSADRQRD